MISSASTEAEPERGSVLRRFGMSGKRSEAPSVIEGRFRIESQIGYGAFGKVFRARDTVTGDDVAVKIFDGRLDETGYLAELGLLFNEAHPSIVTTISFGYSAGRKYIVYEFVRGGSLRDLLIRTPRVNPSEALRLMRDVCEGLAFAHDRRVIHRDLKPENLLLADAKTPCRVKICDFGLSARFRPGDRLSSQFGSPAYMAPEQFGEEYDHRIDLYAVGVILYELLFGRRPHTGDAVSLRHAHRHVPPAMPEDGPPHLVEFLTRAMAKDPDERFGSAQEMVEAIDRLLAEESASGLGRVNPPAFESIELLKRWKMRIPRRMVNFVSTEEGDLIVALDDRIIRLDVDGNVETLTRTTEPVSDFALRMRSEGPIVWASSGRLYSWFGGEVRALTPPCSVPDGPRSLVLSPDGRHLAVAATEYVDVVELDASKVLWRAEVATYGQPTEVSFDTGGGLLWIASEAPRTQLVALTLDGERVCRTAAGASDAILLDAPSGVVVGSRGKRQLHKISESGFVTHRLELSASLYSLEQVTERLLAAYSARHIELVDRETLASYALVPRPDDNELLVAAGAGVFLLEMDGASLVARRYELERTV